MELSSCIFSSLKSWLLNLDKHVYHVYTVYIDPSTSSFEYCDDYSYRPKSSVLALTEI